MDKEYVATRIMPSLLPLCVDPDLNAQQFKTFIKALHNMLKYIESQHAGKLEQAERLSHAVVTAEPSNTSSPFRKRNTAEQEDRLRALLTQDNTTCNIEQIVKPVTSQRQTSQPTGSSAPVAVTGSLPLTQNTTVRSTQPGYASTRQQQTQLPMNSRSPKIQANPNPRPRSQEHNPSPFGQFPQQQQQDSLRMTTSQSSPNRSIPKQISNTSPHVPMLSPTVPILTPTVSQSHVAPNSQRYAQLPNMSHNNPIMRPTSAPAPLKLEKTAQQHAADMESKVCMLCIV